MMYLPREQEVVGLRNLDAAAVLLNVEDVGIFCNTHALAVNCMESVMDNKYKVMFSYFGISRTK